MYIDSVFLGVLWRCSEEDVTLSFLLWNAFLSLNMKMIEVYRDFFWQKEIRAQNK